MEFDSKTQGPVIDFVNWVQGQMNIKRFNQADIARTGIVTRQAVSSLFTLQVKSVGIDMCRAISVASDIPLVTIYRKAGLLPHVDLPQSKRDELDDILNSIIDIDLIEDAIDLLTLLKLKQEKRK